MSTWFPCYKVETWTSFSKFSTHTRNHHAVPSYHSDISFRVSFTDMPPLTIQSESSCSESFSAIYLCIFFIALPVPIITLLTCVIVYYPSPLLCGRQDLIYHIQHCICIARVPVLYKWILCIHLLNEWMNHLMPIHPGYLLASDLTSLAASIYLHLITSQILAT